MESFGSATVPQCWGTRVVLLACQNRRYTHLLNFIFRFGFKLEFNKFNTLKIVFLQYVEYKKIYSIIRMRHEEIHIYSYTDVQSAPYIEKAR